MTVIWHYKSTAHDRRERLRAIQKRVDEQARDRREAFEKGEFFERIAKDSCPITGPDACPVCASAVEVARQFYSQAK